MEHRGLGRTTWQLARFFDRDNSALLRIGDDSFLRIHLDDGYWTALLDPQYRYESQMHEVLDAILTPETYFFDGGANIGYWSILVQNRARGVVAVEATPRTFERLQENAGLNGSQVTTRLGALWRADGEPLTIVTHARRHARSSVVTRRDEVGEGGYFAESVTSVTIDSLAGEYFSDASAPVILKLDVEGAEIAALEGAKRTFAERDVVVLYEDHGRDPSCGVSVYLADLGFKLFAFPSGASPEEVSPRQIAELKTEPKKGYNFAACEPESAFRDKLHSL
jgi:FkbM family methyltransferase